MSVKDSVFAVFVMIILLAPTTLYIGSNFHLEINVNFTMHSNLCFLDREMFCEDIDTS